MSGPLAEAFAAFTAYLRAPTLIEPAGLRGEGSGRMWRGMALLHLGVLLAVLLPFLRFWQDAFALPSPDAYGKLPAMVVVPMVIVVAPMVEEALFRGWLTGRPRALWLLGCGTMLAALGLDVVPGMAPTGTTITVLAMVVIAPAGWFVLRRRPALAVMRAGFPVVFYASALAFALVHLANYPSISLAAVPLVLPQLWTGLTAGFVRMQIGLPGSVALHALSNTLALALAVGLARL